VTFCTGDIGNTSGFARGFDVLESEHGHGRTTAFCRPPFGKREHDGGLPVLRDISKDRLQNRQFLSGLRTPMPCRIGPGGPSATPTNYLIRSSESSLDSSRRSPISRAKIRELLLAGDIRIRGPEHCSCHSGPPRSRQTQSAAQQGRGYDARYRPIS
jgi:hypothetical protein